MASPEPAPTAKRAAIEAAVLGATEALSREGASYADLDVERIATRAGISRTAFYFYFRDKRELLMRVTGGSRTRSSSRRALVWTSGGPATELRTALAPSSRSTTSTRCCCAPSSRSRPTTRRSRRSGASCSGASSTASARRIEASGAGRPTRPTTAFALCWMTERTLYQHLVQESAPPSGTLVEALSAIWTRAVYPA